MANGLSVQPGLASEKRPLGPFAVSAVGYGAMRLAGPNVFGPPANSDDAVALLRVAIQLGVNHIDTAQYYGPAVVNELIRSALHPYPPDLVLASKVGARRGSRGEIFADDKPSQLREGIEENLQTLGTDCIGVVNLRLMRSATPDAFFEDQLLAMISARQDGLIRAIGLSNVSLVHLLHALKLTDIACVQNEFHVANRTSQPVLDECVRRGIATPHTPSRPSERQVLGRFQRRFSGDEKNAR
jgi:pyridoxine 4-dehydrogenase